MQFACIAGDSRVPPGTDRSIGDGETRPQDPAPRTAMPPIFAALGIITTADLTEPR
jgi:hypothetical protein